MTNPGAVTSFRRELLSAVQSAIDAGRVGRPVFVRWTARVPSGAQHDTHVAEALEAVSGWLDGRPEFVHQPGGSSAHALWPDGQAALVTVGPCLDGEPPGVDVMLLGSSGAIHHDGQAIRRLDMVN